MWGEEVGTKAGQLYLASVSTRWDSALGHGLYHEGIVVGMYPLARAGGGPLSKLSWAQKGGTSQNVGTTPLRRLSRISLILYVILTQIWTPISEKNRIFVQVHYAVRS
jgi:hypothetical protein